ncbi:MAG: von Willebrand factor type A domain-containing protein [Verrucomicrobiota bacterium JB022]|nr:von Willebrand factor type A domain-containing protein [Verrucomicrobiota bacterium JB022]
MKPEDQSLLTAYALGEDLTPEQRAQVEQLLRDDPAAAAHVAETEQLGNLLLDAYDAEPLPSGLQEQVPVADPTPFIAPKAAQKRVLNDDQRKARVEALKAKAPQLKRTPFLTYQALLTSAAACLVLVGMYYAMNIVQMLMEPQNTGQTLTRIEPTSEDDLRRGAIQELVDQLEADEAARVAEDNRRLQALQEVDLLALKEQTEQQARQNAAPTLEELQNVDLRPRPSPRARIEMYNLDAPVSHAAPERPVPLQPLDLSTPDLQGLASTQTMVGGLPAAPETSAPQPQSLPPYTPVAAADATDSDERVFDLSPFEVSSADARSTTSLGVERRRIIPAPPSAKIAPAASTLQYFAPPSDVPPVPMPRPIEVQPAPTDREAYDSLDEKPFVSPVDEPLSTFSVDVDTASYANVRRFLNEGQLPPEGAVRIEELLNYFRYQDAAPETRDEPLAVHTEIAQAPWAPEHQLLRIAVKGYEMPWEERPATNLVFLIDVSGSMNAQNKLPLVKAGLRELVQRLDARDRVAIVTYAGSDHVALPSTTANNTETILHAIDQLGARGSTNGEGGLKRAYAEARKHLAPELANRVILCSDGDFNVGVTNRSELVNLIEKEAKTGVYLSILGFGMGNYQDATLEELSNKGNGNYAYIDSEKEARRVLVDGAVGNLVPIAKDVKIQVEFNPAHVQAYRLIGYENRALAAQDFNNDQKDAGEIGAGHQVVALYEIIPPGVEWQPAGTVDGLKYQPTRAAEAPAAASGELATVKLRYKAAEVDNGTLDGFSETSTLREFPVAAPQKAVRAQQASADFRFSAAVAGFGLKLRKSDAVEEFGWPRLLQMAKSATANDPDRQEFVELLSKAEALEEER